MVKYIKVIQSKEATHYYKYGNKDSGGKGKTKLDVTSYIRGIKRPLRKEVLDNAATKLSFLTRMGLKFHIISKPTYDKFK